MRQIQVSKQSQVETAQKAPPGRGFRGTAVAPEFLFIGGAISQYLGAALAVFLFSSVPAAGVAWLRVASAAVILGAWRRPWRRWPVRRFWLTVAFGTALASMNISFYLALARLPLGTTVAIEFCGPVTVAALSSRARRDWFSLVLAACGVLLVADVRLAATPAGVAFACLAAVFWAVYILLGHRVAAAGAGLDGLSVGMAAGALVLAAAVAPSAAPAFASPLLLGAAVGVGLLSSVVPYALEQLAMARLRRGRFALLLSLLPATAVIVGVVVLGQIPKPVEIVGIASVIGAVASARRADAF